MHCDQIKEDNSPDQHRSLLRSNRTGAPQITVFCVKIFYQNVSVSSMHQVIRGQADHVRASGDSRLSGDMVSRTQLQEDRRSAWSAYEQW